MLKIGVLGAGHLGKIHINCIKQIEQYGLVGFYDPADETAQLVEDEMNVKRFQSIDELIEAVDVVDIVTPTIRHFECASKALQKRKHVFNLLKSVKPNGSLHSAVILVMRRLWKHCVRFGRQTNTRHGF